MRKISAFVFTSLNGYYKGLNEDISWHKHGEEEMKFSEEGANSGSILLFGRVTYEMMSGFWPSPMALEMMPGVAAGMNNSEKIVYSRTLKQANWNNTSIISDDIINETKKLKEKPGNDMTILGSGSIVSQFSEAGLIDELQIMIDPVAIAKGTALFENINQTLTFQLVSTRTFKSGVILLNYIPQ